MQTDIAKYAMWLFDHTPAPWEQLPDLYDQLCDKNPVRCDSFSFDDFQALFDQWRWRQLNQVLDGPSPVVAIPNRTPVAEETCHTNGEIAHVLSTSAIPNDGFTQGEAAQVMSVDVAPVSDYHVVTEFLIERLIAEVKEYLELGWTPVGGICRSNTSSDMSYWAQAIVLYQPD